MGSWLKCLVEIRNICAHYGRIYNRKLNSSPGIPREYNISEQSEKKLFPVLLIIILLLNNYKRSTNFITKIKSLIDEYEVVDIHLLGFPPDWEKVLREAR